MDIPLFINARTDVMLYNSEPGISIQKVDELISRGSAYKEAGANCFFPIALKEKEDIQELVTTKMPINILAIPGIPGLNTLNEMGVSRLTSAHHF